MSQSVIYHPESDCYLTADVDNDVRVFEEGCHPVSPDAIPAGYSIQVGLGHSTVLPDLDFETYSEAGYYYDKRLRKWKMLPGTPKTTKNGLASVGAAAYAEHPSTEVISLAYNLKDGSGPQLWRPGDPLPRDLFHHIQSGGLLEAWNSAFEFFIWYYVCVKKMGWPMLPYTQLRDAMAKGKAFGLPGALAKAGQVLRVEDLKISDGSRLLKKFSQPRNPTKKDDRLRIHPNDDPEDGPKLWGYNLGDIKTESQISALTPDLSTEELRVWLFDQKVNFRGCYVDVDATDACCAIIDQAFAKYDLELGLLTGFHIKTASETQKIRECLRDAHGIDLPNLDADAVAGALKRDDISPTARRILEIRASLGAASVKKAYAIRRRVNNDGYLRGLFAYYGAERTGRWAGRGPQPQNLPNSGPTVWQCGDMTCRKHYGLHHTECPHCQASADFSDKVEWNIDAVEDAVETIKMRDLDHAEHVWGDAVATVSACLRGLFCAAPEHDLICSDFSAIEAVVLACLAREQWRIDVFRTHGKIYEKSAADISGIPFEEILAHKEQTGEDHPLRKKIGKVAELASGYQGWIGAWKAFGADKFFKSEDEIKDAILKWRAASPNIVKLWYGLEDAVKSAIMNPGQCFQYNDLIYGMRDGHLYCRLPSGRNLIYRNARLIDGTSKWGKPIKKILYDGWNSDYKKGPLGWVTMDTYGGKLTENATQAVARDIMTNSMLNLEEAGYGICLHVHDEPVAQVPKGVGSIEEFEAVASKMPAWCADWPITISGGWRGKRYRKD